MRWEDVVLYGCAAAVVVGGLRVATEMVRTEAPAGGRPWNVTDSLQPAARAWRARPVPVVSGFVFTVTTVMALLAIPFPGLVDTLGRDPHALADGQWWRLVSPLLVQSSGWVQATLNAAAMLVVGPIAEQALGRTRWLVIYLGSGIAAHAVSMAGWSPFGGGNSVAICGLVAAMAVLYLIQAGPAWRAARLLAGMVPLAGLILCAVRNNHGIGLVAGSVFGVLFAVLPRPVGIRPVDRTAGRNSTTYVSVN